MVHDHWARVATCLRSLLTSGSGNTCVSIQADGNKTVIRMGGGDTKDTNNHFRLLQDCLEWVQTKLVSALTTNSINASFP